MTSGSTREFMALCAIHQHLGRPGTPTDQAWIESLFGHVKAEYPQLLAIRDPAILRAELAWVREHYNSVRLHAGIGETGQSSCSSPAFPAAGSTESSPACSRLAGSPEQQRTPSW
jgi:transposase InsO family protein